MCDCVGSTQGFLEKTAWGWEQTSLPLTVLFPEVQGEASGTKATEEAELAPTALPC